MPIEKQCAIKQLDAPVTLEKYQQIRELWKKHCICEDNRDIEGILSTLSTDCVYEIKGTEYVWRGKKEVLSFYHQMLAAVPDAKFDLQNIVIGPQGVFEEAILSGTHKGDYFSYKASQKKIRETIGILFPWDDEKRLFSGEVVYVNLDSLFS